MIDWQKEFNFYQMCFLFTLLLFFGCFFSHDVAAPATPECQEVSAYINHNISMPAQDLWQVKILGQEADDPVWHAIQSQVHLIHVGTKAALSLTGVQLPDWAFNQWEMVTCEAHEQYTQSLWTVEEHRYTTQSMDWIIFPQTPWKN